MGDECAAWADAPRVRTVLPMNKFDEPGLEEHAVQQAANAWQWACYGDDGAPYLHQAVAMNLAIAVCGELNALEGDGWGYGTTGAKTQTAIARFIDRKSTRLNSSHTAMSYAVFCLL